MPELEAGPVELHDPLSPLLLENFTDQQRVALLRRNYEWARAQFRSRVTPDIAKTINDTCDITFVFNYHGDEVDAVRTVNTIWAPGDDPRHKPFLTFVEGSHNRDLHEPGYFSYSINTAFDHEFNGKPATLPEAANPRDWGSWEYWRDRGIIERGSIFVSVDLRHYSAQYVETLIGQKFAKLLELARNLLHHAPLHTALIRAVE